MANADLIRVRLVHGAAPHEVWSLALDLPAGARVLDALKASGWAERLGAAALDALAISVWNRAVRPDTVLREGDRIELSRGLRVDPKEARRQRYRRDGLRKAPRRMATRDATTPAVAPGEADTLSGS